MFIVMTGNQGVNCEGAASCDGNQQLMTVTADYHHITELTYKRETTSVNKSPIKLIDTHT